MTPTIEEVKRVAIESGASVWPITEIATFSFEQLQAFAQHWIEVGEKKPRDSVVKSINKIECNFYSACPTRDCSLMCEDRIISNNTGE